MKIKFYVKRTVLLSNLLIVQAVNSQPQSDPVVSPEIQSDNQVIFRLKTPEANYVKLGVMSMGLNARYGQYVKDEHITQLNNLDQAKPKIYRIACGKKDFLFQGVLDMMNLYDEIGFEYTYRENRGGHSWNNRRLYLTEFAPMLFK